MRKIVDSIVVTNLNKTKNEELYTSILNDNRYAGEVKFKVQPRVTNKSKLELKIDNRDLLDSLKEKYYSINIDESAENCYLTYDGARIPCKPWHIRMIKALTLEQVSMSNAYSACIGALLGVFMLKVKKYSNHISDGIQEAILFKFIKSDNMSALDKLVIKKFNDLLEEVCS